MRKEVILKWGTVGILALSAVFFFLPYRADFSAFKIIDMAAQLKLTETVIEGILQCVVPVVFTLLSALIMALRFGKGKCIVATIFNIFATLLHIAHLNIGSGSVGIGLIFNLGIAIVGIALPIVNIFIQKVSVKK